MVPVWAGHYKTSGTDSAIIVITVGKNELKWGGSTENDWIKGVLALCGMEQPPTKMGGWSFWRTTLPRNLFPKE